MNQSVEFHQRVADMAPHGNRQSVERVSEVAADAPVQIAFEMFERPAYNWGRKTEKAFCIGARLNDDQIRLAEQKQDTVGLYRAGQMNLFPLAVGQVGLPEGRSRKTKCNQITTLPGPSA
jgi:hypothetical protein